MNSSESARLRYIRPLTLVVALTAWCAGAAPCAFRFGSGEEGGGELLVEGEKVLDALALAGEGLRAITQVHRPVQVGMGFDQGRRHRKRVIQVCQRRTRKLCPHI